MTLGSPASFPPTASTPPRSSHVWPPSVERPKPVKPLPWTKNSAESFQPEHIVPVVSLTVSEVSLCVVELPAPSGTGSLTSTSGIVEPSPGRTWPSTTSGLPMTSGRLHALARTKSRPSMRPRFAGSSSRAQSSAVTSARLGAGSSNAVEANTRTARTINREILRSRIRQLLVVLFPILGAGGMLAPLSRKTFEP